MKQKEHNKLLWDKQINTYKNFVPTLWPIGNPEFRIAIVGEAPGAKEAETKVPFIGPAGKILNGILFEVGLKRRDVMITNVFQKRPFENNIQKFFMKKSEAKKEGWDKECQYPLFGTRGFIHPNYVDHLDRLYEELMKFQPQLILSLGATSLWALSGLDKIGKERGALRQIQVGYHQTLLMPTYHPAAILRQWKFLPVAVADFNKAINTLKGKVNNKERTIWIEPNLDDIENFLNSSSIFSVDIETSNDEITCVGFAKNDKEAMVIPFVHNDGSSYWPTLDEETEAWLIVKRALENENIVKIGQNFTFDMQWLHRYKILVRGKVEDTMLLHHALQPEMPKSLGFMASTYLNVPSWKELVSHSKNLKDDA